MKTFLSACAVLTMAMAMPALAQTTTTKMEEVPVHVRAAATAAARGGKLDSVQVEMERGMAIYEFKASMPDGKKMEIDIKHTGEVEEVEEVVDKGAVPQPAMQALMRLLPGFQPTLMERSTRNNFEVFYEFEGKDSRGTEVDIEVRADGKVILIADDEAN